MMVNVTFKTGNGISQKVEATPGQSLMEVAVANAVPGIDAECGGSMSCATCHCYVDTAWFEKTGTLSEGEADMLEFADKPMKATSRLSCQITITDALDGLVVEVPA